MQLIRTNNINNYLKLYQYETEKKGIMLDIDMVIILTIHPITDKKIIKLINHIDSLNIASKIGVVYNNLSIPRYTDKFKNNFTERKTLRNIADAEYHVYKYLNQHNINNILWLEEDVILSKIISYDIIKNNINNFINNVDFDVLRLGHVSIMQTLLSLYFVTRLIFSIGFQCVIISKSGRIKLMNWRKDCLRCSDEFHLSYFIKSGKIKDFINYKQYGYFVPLGTQIFRNSPSSRNWKNGLLNFLLNIFGLTTKYSLIGYYLIQFIPLLNFACICCSCLKLIIVMICYCELLLRNSTYLATNIFINKLTILTKISNTLLIIGYSLFISLLYIQN